MGVLEANMTVANVVEVVVVLAILYVAYRFYQKTGLIAMKSGGVPVKSSQVS